MNNHNVSVRISNGAAKFIYDDSMRDLLHEGPAEIMRVSFVEPEGLDWFATMIDGVKLGPFLSRQEALEAERAYLEEKMFNV